MSLELQISELNATIKTLNENILLLLGSKEQHSKVECSTVEPERESLQAFCLEAVKRNVANRDIIKSIMLNNFEARKTGDLADNQINLCYSMIAEATKD